MGAAVRQPTTQWGTKAVAQQVCSSSAGKVQARTAQLSNPAAARYGSSRQGKP